ncbi:MAG: hypothetical protein IT270_15510 [Saprospiraceae bacterium]|nr:hypothetical protein [Saprospiraceae bacterium]
MGGIRWSFLVTVPMLVVPVWRAAWHFRRHGLKDVGLEKSDLYTASGKRFRHYYTGTAFLGVLFEMINGRSRNRDERRRFCLMAALAAHFDDLSDFPGSGGAVMKNYAHPADPAAKARKLLEQVENDLPKANKTLFYECLNTVYRIETESRQTGDVGLDAETLATLTSEKGANSVLLFRCLLDWPVSEAEKQALWAFGSLLQRCDDTFDVWFDRQSQTQTLATFWLNQNNPEALAADYTFAIKTTHFNFKNLPFSPFRRAMAWNTAATIAAIGKVCTLHYVDLKKKHGTLPLDNRKLMVTDMGKWNNRLRALWYWVG